MHPLASASHVVPLARVVHVILDIAGSHASQAFIGFTVPVEWHTLPLIRQYPSRIGFWHFPPEHVSPVHASLSSQRLSVPSSVPPSQSSSLPLHASSAPGFTPASPSSQSPGFPAV